MLISLFFVANHTTGSSIFPKPPTLTGKISNPLSWDLPKISSGGLSIPVHNGSQTRPFRSAASNGSYSQTSTITAAPAVPSNSLDMDEQARICFDGNQDCTYTGMTETVVGPDQPLHLSDECLLWNTSCTGNKTLAIDEFFNGTLFWLQENECFVSPLNASLDCSKYVSQDVMSEFAVIKDWMRSPQCLSSSSEYKLMQGQTPFSYMLGDSCCDFCEISAQNVDIYYWPDHDANTSCLSIVGNSVNPLLYDATRVVTTSNGSPMSSTITYWGCTVQDPSIGLSYMSTAQLTSIDSITFKEALVDPWSAPPCVEKASAFPSPSMSIEARGLRASIHARGHSLVLPFNITQNNGLLASTVVMGEYTL